MVTKHRNMYNSIIDITYYMIKLVIINYYLAFDIYHKNGENFNV